MILRTIAAATAVTISFAATAGAATLGGLFQVTVVNVTNLNSSESEARIENLVAASNKALGGGDFGGADSVAIGTVFTYDGSLDFRVEGSQNADYTIGQWFATGGGIIASPFSGFDFSDVSGLQLSRSNIDNGTAETTFMLFSLLDATPADFTIVHDDGVAVFDDTVEIGFNRGPTGETTTFVEGFNGGTLEFLYVATNGNPSILEVDATPVPLPATAPLLAGALGLAGWAVRRRRKAA
jgi:hypothetical protein